MGLDLSLIPDFTPNLKDSPILAVSELLLSRDYGVFDAIKELRPRPFTRGVNRYEDDGLKLRHTDAYGEGLTVLSADQLADWFEEAAADHNLLDPESWRTLAAIGYVSAMPGDADVVLFWH